MRRRTDRWAAMAIAMAIAGVPSPADEPIAPGPGIVEREHVRLVSHRIRAMPRSGASADACTELRLSGLDIRWRGRDVPPRRRIELLWDHASVERRLHVLAIDTSGSMRGDLTLARAAARSYLDAVNLRRDRAAVLTFDDSVLLLQAPTERREALDAALDRVRLGGYTSFHDGLERVIDATTGVLEQQVVVVLVTDAADSASRSDGREVFERVRDRPDWTVFGIGLKLPSIRAGRSVADPARLLQRLSTATGGRMYRIDAASRLDQTFDDVHRRLGLQATLTLADDDGKGRGKLRVRVPGGRCRIEVLSEGVREPSAKGADAANGRTVRAGDGIAWHPGRTTERRRRLRPDRVLDERCTSGATEGRPSFLRRRDLSGCVLDSVVAGGLLHDADEIARRSTDAAWQLRRRPVRVMLDDDGPRDVLTDWLDELGDIAASLPVEPPWTDPFRRPAERHAYPFENHPSLVEGQTLLDMREALALLLDGGELHGPIRRSLSFAIERERAWLGRWMSDATGATDDELEWIVGAGGGARAEELERRLREPGTRDLMAHAAAWLGDLPAAELFADWEARTIAAGRIDLPVFRRRYEALRRVFFASSYARVVGVLAPTWDRDRRRIGFWRVILPRPGWYLERVQGRRRQEDWRDLPLDLIPERPMAVELAVALEADDPRAAAALRRRLAGGSFRYRSLARPRDQGPEDALDHVAIRWDAPSLKGEVAVRWDPERRGPAPDAVAALGDLVRQPEVDSEGDRDHTVQGSRSPGG